jgi:predicted oxidoreductase
MGQIGILHSDLNRINLKAKMVRDKAQWKADGRVRVEAFMAKAARELNLRYGKEQKKVKNYTEIGYAFKHSGTYSMCSNIWYVLHGTWDNNPGVFDMWEKEIMEKRKEQYLPSRARDALQFRSVCFNELLRASKRDRVRGTNYCGLRSHHGRHVIKSREKVPVKEKYDKRKKSTFFPHYVLGPVSKANVFHLR